MTILLWLIALIALLLALKNHFQGKNLMEEIDDLRNSYLDLRKDMKAGKDMTLAELYSLKVDYLKSQGRLKGKTAPYRITEDCIACGSCLPECPVEAIAEGEVYLVDLEKCTGCAACAKVCPVEACVQIG